MSRRLAPAPEIELLPIDDFARDGRYQLVFDRRGEFAVARYVDESWSFSSGAPLDFDPTDYHPVQGAAHA